MLSSAALPLHMLLTTLVNRMCTLFFSIFQNWVFQSRSSSFVSFLFFPTTLVRVGGSPQLRPCEGGRRGTPGQPEAEESRKTSLAAPGVTPRRKEGRKEGRKHPLWDQAIPLWDKGIPLWDEGVSLWDKGFLCGIKGSLCGTKGSLRGTKGSLCETKEFLLRILWICCTFLRRFVCVLNTGMTNRTGRAPNTIITGFFIRRFVLWAMRLN